MRTLDTERSYERITPPENGAHYEQDGVRFDASGVALNSSAPQPAAADAQQSGFVIDEPASASDTLPHATTDNTTEPQQPAPQPEPQPETQPASASELEQKSAKVKRSKAAPFEPYNRLRDALYAIDGYRTAKRSQMFLRVYELTGVEPEGFDDGYELLKSEGLVQE